MLPDYELPETPEGYEYIGFRTPQLGDYMVDFYGKPYLITASRLQYVFENHPVFKKLNE